MYSFYQVLDVSVIFFNNNVDHFNSKILPACLNLIFDILNKSVTCINKRSGILFIYKYLYMRFLSACMFLLEIDVSFESIIS